MALWSFACVVMAAVTLRQFGCVDDFIFMITFSKTPTCYALLLKSFHQYALCHKKVRLSTPMS